MVVSYLCEVKDMNSLKTLRLCSKHQELLYGVQKQLSTGKFSLTKNVKPSVQAPGPASSHGSEVVLSPIVPQPLPNTEEPVKQIEPGVLETGLPEEASDRQPFSYDVRKVDPTTVKQVYFFDTLELVKTLQNNGFTRQQAEGLSQSLVEVINSTLEHQTRHMITKSQQEITVQQLMSEIASVKKDMVILQRSEFSALRNETEKQTFEIRQIKDSLRDEIAKLKGQMTLDINLERSRAVEAHAENQKNLLRTNQKIETQVAHLRTTYEQYRNDVFKYAGGTVLTCAGLCLGIMRIWS